MGETRQTTLTFDAGGAKLLVERFQSVERLSEPFVVTVDVLVKGVEVDFLPLLGKAAAIEVSDGGGPIRQFHGLLFEASLIDATSDAFRYQLILRPRLYLLTQNRDYRIFQEKTALEIIRSILDEKGFSDVVYDRLQKTFLSRDYCVQYRESDFDFISRLMEQEGVYYYFEHTKTAHKLVLADSASAHRKAPNYEVIAFNGNVRDGVGVSDRMWRWTERVTTGGHKAVRFRNFDFKKPEKALATERVVDASHPFDQVEIYDYAADFLDPSAGEDRARIELEARRVDRRVFAGLGDAPGLACGNLFTLADHTVRRFNDSYLITALAYDITAESYSTGGGDQGPTAVTLEAIPATTPFRAPLRTPRPVARGPETATVSGPTSDKIFVDEFGRIKVRFHWDRSPDAENPTTPDKASCWIRVSHHSAGENFGHVVTPRVGQEVVVDFLDGDPDRPLIVGRVYNNNRKHPYEFPTSKTRSVWMSRSLADSKPSYSGAENPPAEDVGGNEIRFEDLGGEEELFVRAWRDMKTHVQYKSDLVVEYDTTERFGHDRTTAVKNNETVTIEEGDETHTVSKGSRTTKIFKDETLTVDTGNLKTTISQGNHDIAVSMGNYSTKISMGNYSTQVSMGNYSIKADLGKVTIDALQSITLTVGANSVTIDQMGVSIKGLMVKSEGSIMNQTKAPMVQIEGQAMTMVKGAIVMIN